ncbi:MAG TPA: RluA family pseudouridine synthase [Clostridia bacterium]|nr:RluA family pseudouridine synthase [Clostridia bacterium]
MQNFQFLVSEEEEKTRIDSYLAAQSQLQLSRSRLQKLIDDGKITVNNKKVKANYKLKKGDLITLSIPPAKEYTAIKPESIPLDILYEDEDLLVINKPQGMVVHPAHGHYSGTLVNALLYHCSDLSGINGVMRPGIVHRLDKDTSGLMLVAKNDYAHLALAEQIKNREVKRKYLAIVFGNVKEDEFTIDAPIGRHPVDRKKMSVTLKNSKPARTRVRVLERYGGNYTLIEASLETGRTHQIRVHMANIGHPVVGDPVYGPKKQPFKLPGQMLHAAELVFKHPKTGQMLTFKQAIPPIMESLIEKLRKTI